jgi:excisionase family DNA binding protein
MPEMSAIQRKVKAFRELPSPEMCRAIRREAGITQVDIARSLEPAVTRETVSRWETGDRRPRGEHLVQYVESLRSLQSGGALKLGLLLVLLLAAIEPLHDYASAASTLCCSPRLVRALVERRELESVRVGRLVRIEEEAIRRYIDQRRRPAQQDSK